MKRFIHPDYEPKEKFAADSIEYKGYTIDKSWKEDYRGNRIPGTIRYMVSEGDDWIGDVYKTLGEAKRYVDELVASDVTASISLEAILSDPEGKKLVDSIEEAEEECRGRGIDFDDDSEFWARARKSDIRKLKSQFGYTWR